MTINDAGYYNLDKNDTEGDPKSDPKEATHTSDEKKGKDIDTDTTNRNYPQKILINRTILTITTPIDLRILDKVAAFRGTLYALQMPTSKVIIMDAARSSAHFPEFWGRKQDG